VTTVIDFASMSSALAACFTASLTLCPASTSELALNSNTIVAWSFIGDPSTAQEALDKHARGYEHWPNHPPALLVIRRDTLNFETRRIVSFHDVN